MKNTIILFVSLFSLSASAQDQVIHCTSQCVSLNSACRSGFEGEVFGVARSRRQAFNRMAQMCNARAGGNGLLLTDISGFHMESVSSSTTVTTRWPYYWSRRTVSWAIHCNLEIYGTPATSGDDAICRQEREEDLDIPYTGDLPVLD